MAEPVFTGQKLTFLDLRVIVQEPKAYWSLLCRGGELKQGSHSLDDFAIEGWKCADSYG